MYKILCTFMISLDAVVVVFFLLVLTIVGVVFHKKRGWLLVLLVLGVAAVLGLEYGGLEFGLQSWSVLQVVAFVCYVLLLFFASEVHFVRLDTQQQRALRLFVLFWCIFVGVATVLLAGVFQSMDWQMAFVLAVLLAVPGSGLPLLSARVRELLEYEQKYAALVTLLIPVLVVPFVPHVPVVLVVSSLKDYVVGLVLGVGVGIFVGVSFSKLHVFRHQTSGWIAALVSVLLASVSFAFAEALGGSGVLAVVALGVFCTLAFRSHPELKCEKKIVAVLSVVSVLGASALFVPAFFRTSQFTFFIVLLVMVLLVLFYGVRFLISQVLFKRVLRAQDHAVVAFCSPIGFESLVVLFFVATNMIPLGVEVEPFRLVVHAVLLSTLITHFIALVVLPFVHRR